MMDSYFFETIFSYVLFSCQLKYVSSLMMEMISDFPTAVLRLGKNLLSFRGYK